MLIFYPLVYSTTARKAVCISMTNPARASTQTFKSKVGISIGEFSFQVPSSSHILLASHFASDGHPFLLSVVHLMHFTDIMVKSCLFSVKKKISMPVEAFDNGVLLKHYRIKTLLFITSQNMVTIKACLDSRGSIPATTSLLYNV